MTEAQAKEQLTEMLDSLTIGSILHLLADIFAEEASGSDGQDTERFSQVEHTLFVVGLGLDAILPT